MASRCQEVLTNPIPTAAAEIELRLANAFPKPDLGNEVETVRGIDNPRAGDYNALHMINRADRFLATGLLGFASMFVTVAEGQTAQTPPPASILQSGDLIWPKKPNAFIPYTLKAGAAEENDGDRWRNEKKAFLKTFEYNPNPTEQERRQYEKIRPMTYDEFRAYYFDDRLPGVPAKYSTGAISVGHVGIIQSIDNQLTVVEAVLGVGVRRIPYAQWVTERSGEIFWVGRWKEPDGAKRAKIAEKAAEQIAKPYNFWNFDLEDTSGFYCSKLAWYSILKATGISADDNPARQRPLWYSPKQLMKSPHLELIVNPGNYGGH